MMPSRGSQLARGGAPRLYQAQCRNLSSASRRIQPRTTRTALPNQRIPQWRLSTPLAIASISSIRHASTTPSAPPTTQPATPHPPASVPAESTSTSFPNLDTITLDNIDLSTTSDIANLPEKIGYLHEIGLNYGWGPTSMIQWAVEHIHIYSGLPWWGAVALTAMGIRLVMLPLYIKSSDQVARTQALMSVTKPISEKMSAAQKSGDTTAVQAAWMEMRAVRKRAGLSFVDQMAPMFIQAVIGYCGFKLMRAMAALPVPALKTDGFLWLQDLTIADPYLLLPAVMAGTIHMLIRMGGESGAAGVDQMAPGMRAMMLWGMPGIILLVTGFQAGLVVVWFAAGGVLGIMQSLALKNAEVRRRLGIAPLYKPSQEEIDRGVMGNFMERIYGKRGAGGAAAAAASGPRSKGAWMNPTYQSPNLRRNMNSTGPQQQHSGRIIDVSPVTKTSSSSTNPKPNTSTFPAANDDMIQPNAPVPSSTEKKTGVFGKAGQQFKDFRKQYFEKKVLSEAEMERQRREAFKRRARNYEDRFVKGQGKRR